jgi:23S rRNA pseudouridine1911/1915/1917 synthase
MPELKVETEQAGARLDRFLAEAQTDLSRSRIQSLIREGMVTVNGSHARAALKLKAGDRVTLELPPPRTVSLAPEDIALDVVHEDDDLLVINKPIGIVVHPGAGVKSGTIVHALLHRDPAIADVGGATRPGIVHRLDKETSGLMVIARTPRAYRALVEAIREREVSRIYRAIVWGSLATQSGEIGGAIGRDPRNRKRMAVVRSGGKPAFTSWRVLERFGPATLIEVTLATGRTHQIRVHFSDRGHPLVGDPLYGGRGKKQLSAGEPERRLSAALLEGLPRQALHASELALRHPVTGRALRWTSSVPEDFARSLDLLREFRDRRAP